MLEILTIVILALFSLWGAIAAAMAMGLDPAPMILALTLGYTLSVTLVIRLGAPLRNRLCRRMGSNGLAQHVFHRYGPVGLGLIAPVVTGGPVGAALGLAFQTSPRRLVLWMAIGAALWSVLLTIPALVF